MTDAEFRVIVLVVIVCIAIVVMEIAKEDNRRTKK